MISRNHPRNAEEIRQAHRLGDGGEHFLIGYRNLPDRARLVVATRVAGDRQRPERSRAGAR